MYVCMFCLYIINTYSIYVCTYCMSLAHSSIPHTPKAGQAGLHRMPGRLALAIHLIIIIIIIIIIIVIIQVLLILITDI